MKNFKAEICLFCWVHFCFALLGYFQRRLQMNGISFILSSGHEAPPHHKCMMDASAQSEFSTHEALSVISHAKERSNKVCCNYTVVQQVLDYLKKVLKSILFSNVLKATYFFLLCSGQLKTFFLYESKWIWKEWWWTFSFGRNCKKGDKRNQYLKWRFLGAVHTYHDPLHCAQLTLSPSLQCQGQF